jgi:amidophosphoribosyltransferase
VYGIDMQTRTEFVARNRDLDQIAVFLGADRVIYQTLANLKRAVRSENPHLDHFCAACFDGEYVTGDVTPEMLQSIETERQSMRESQLDLNLPR